MALSDGGRLLRTQGTDLPGSATVPAGGTVLVSAEYEALSESASEGDIVATAVFTENMTGRQLTNETTLTAVRVEVVPEYRIQGLENRHVVGVGELMSCQVYPSFANWNAQTKGQGTVESQNNGNAVLRSPFESEINGLVLVFGGGISYAPNIETIEPTGLVVTVAREIAYPEAVSNQAGWVGMTLDMYVVPTNVCFGAISVVEVPEYGMGIPPTGYFTNEVFSSIWHHTEMLGAGEWHELRNDNFFMPDHAYYGRNLPNDDWCDGQITWSIPTAWGYIPNGETQYVAHEFGSVYFQIFTMNPNGVLRIDKLHHWVERLPNGQRRHSQNVMGVPQ